MKKNLPRNICVRAVAILLAIMALMPGAYAFPSSYYTRSSVLHSGRWVKIRVNGSGMHQITDAELQAMGFSRPEKVAVYGFPAVALSNYRLTSEIPDDLPPLPAIYRDGKLIFYAEGDVRTGIKRTGTQAAGYKLPVSVMHNFYASYGTYFLTDSAPAAAPEQVTYRSGFESTVTSGYGMVYHEEERTNAAQLGPYFFGDSFMATPKLEYSLSLPGFIGGTPAYLQLNAGFQTPLAGTLSVTLPSGAVSRVTVPNSDAVSYYYSAVNWVGTDRPAVSDNGLYTVAFDASALRDLTFAAIDYFTYTYRRDNRYTGGQQLIAYDALGAGDRIVIPSTVSDIMVWDVSDPYRPRVFETGVVDSGENSGEVVNYVVSSPGARSVADGNPAYLLTFSPEEELLPVEMVGEVPDQNLHALATPRMVIIAASEFVGEARRLAQAHREVQGIDVEVVCQDDIFNEFSSGTPHVMAFRRFVKMLVDRNPGKLRSVLLFGRANYDNRGILNGDTPAFRAVNMPILHQEDFRLSGHHSKSYATDALAGMMQEDTGGEFNIYRAMMDVNVSRVPADNTGDARSYVDKAIAYMHNPPGARVLNSALVMCDKGDAIGHMADAQGLAETIMAQAPDMVVYKGFNTIFPLDGGRARQLNKYAANHLSKGVCYWAYSGHATPTYFSPQTIWDINLTQETEYDTPPFTVFATCRAAYFDHPGQSLAEACLFAPRGGSITVVGALREVYKEKNQMMNVEMGKHFFGSVPSAVTGDIFRMARNTSVTTDGMTSDDQIINTLSYNMLGDPELPMYRPQYSAVITTVNGAPFTDNATVTLDFGARSVIEGAVVDAEGNIVTGFNGEISMTLFDCMRIAPVINVGSSSVENSWLGYEVPVEDEVIYEAVANVVGGRFAFTAYLPAPLREGTSNRLTLSASSRDNSMHATGSTHAIYVNPAGIGFDTTDGTVPEIEEMYLDSPSFTNGDVVGGDVTFHATIAPDDYRVVGYTSLIGRAVSLTLDGTRTFPDAPMVFVPDPLGGGTIDMPLSDIADGPHSLTLKVSNYAGQTIERTINFTTVNLSGDARLSVEEYPATTVATISLAHTLTDEPTGRIIVKDAAGEVVFTCGDATFPFSWDLRSTSGDTLPSGLYTVETLFSSGLRYGATAPATIVIRR